MSLQVVCSGCRAAFQAKDEWAGKKTKCPKCGQELVIGAGAAARPATDLERTASKSTTMMTPRHDDALPRPAAAGQYVAPMSSADAAMSMHMSMPSVPAAPAAESASSATDPVAAESRAKTLRALQIGGGSVAAICIVGVGYYLMSLMLNQKVADAPIAAKPQIVAIAIDPGPKVEAKPMAEIEGKSDAKQEATIEPEAVSYESMEKVPDTVRRLPPLDTSGNAALGKSLQSMFDDAKRVDWQPADTADALKIEQLIGAVSSARDDVSASSEADAIGEKLQQSEWSFDRHVAKLNAHTIDLLSDGGQTVMCFGHITSCSKISPRRFMMMLAGRGCDIEVTNSIDPATPHQVGDQVLVMGIETMKVPQLELSRVTAGLVVNATWSPPTKETVHQEAADYLRWERRLDLLKALLSEKSQVFPTLKTSSGGDSVHRNSHLLNASGTRFDAIQVAGSKLSPDDDLALFLAAPPGAIENWGITSTDGEISRGFSQSYEFADFAPANEAWPKDSVGKFQSLSGFVLKGSKNHLLWFKFRDDKPVAVHVMGVYVPRRSLSTGHAPLMQQFGFAALEPTASVTLNQLTFNHVGRRIYSTFPPGSVAMSGPTIRTSTSGPQFGGPLRPNPSPTRPMMGGPTVGGMVIRSTSSSSSSSSLPAANTSVASPPPVVTAKLAHVELPSFKPDEMLAVVTVAELPNPGGVKLELINPTVPLYSQIANYEIAAAGSPSDGWSIDGITKKSERKPVARLYLKSGSLKFQWNEATTRTDGAGLRNCLISITGHGAEQVVVLRSVITRDPLVLDFKKDLERLSLGEDLPGEAGLTLVVEGVDKVAAGAAIVEDTVPFKTATFVVLKSAEDQVPGVRIRLVLWKSTVKPELCMRLELTPIASPQNLALLKGKPGSQTQTSAADPDQGDPTASTNQRYLSFTIKGLAGAKQMLETQLRMMREQIVIDERLIVAKNAQIASYSGMVVSANEAAAIEVKIALLRRDIGLLRNEIVQLNNAIPGHLAQLQAFPPLEAFGNSLHLSASVRFRVVYEVGKYEVPLLKVGSRS